MSFILDALKRADQERRQEPPTVTFDSGTEFHHEEATAQRSKSLMVGAGALLVLLLAIAGYFAIQLLHSDRSPTTGAALAVAQSPSKTLVPELTTSVNADAPVTQEPSTKTDDPDNQMLASPTTTSASQVAESQAPESAQEIDSLYASERSAEVQDPAVEQLYREPEPQQTMAPAEAAIPRQSPTATPNSQTSMPPAEPEPTLPAMPQIRDLPWSLQQKIPSISYGSHNYSETGQSYVVINGEQRRPGQQLAQSLRLEEILADGVVLSFEGRRFKLPALSSWVNM